MSRRPRVHESDVADLQQRLQELLSARGAASEEEIARYEADRERVLDLIGDQLREQRDYDASRRRLRAQIERDDSDGWFADGYDAAHQAHLDALAHVDDDSDPQAGEETERRRFESVVSAPYRRSDDATTDLASVERRIGDVHGALLIEDAVAARAEPPTIGQRVLDDEAGQAR
ncbi:hypothetical protein SAMN05216207_101227 [Pseudonocardia ammonioxydans]|uniref:Uncharacterized protein n=1 Tax=Pseudonocardia ammonioxydans TaxID=260086 RepID=A0A1I4XWE5_PSUAM|nr:hypothetical protein [Pseudonocardia ammonioxydans]SFN30134.1 hypothetical protein SAMN05216207_101227 [Pseudonocardia ammonioxydans]